MDRPRLNLPLLSAVLLLHALGALAWQPVDTPPRPEKIVQAVLLPLIQAQPPAPEPTPPVRTPAVPAAVYRPALPAAAAEMSDTAETALAAPAHFAPALAVTHPAKAGLAAATAAVANMTEAATALPSRPPAESAVALAALVRPTAQALAASVSASAGATGSSVQTPGTAALQAAPQARDTAPLVKAAPPVAAQSQAQQRAANMTETAALPGAPSQTAPPARLARAAPGRPTPVAGSDGLYDSADYAENNPQFVYPRLAARLGLEGTVILEVEILPDGRPGEIRLKQSSGHELLDRDARQQMSTWRFKPALRQGRAHGARVSVPVNYRLDSKGKP